MLKGKKVFSLELIFRGKSKKIFFNTYKFIYFIFLFHGMIFTNNEIVENFYINIVDLLPLMFLNFI